MNCFYYQLISIYTVYSNSNGIICRFHSPIRFFYDFQGCLPVFPPAEDNYGVDSCTIICFPTNPIVVAIATCGGLIYHCVVLESEEDDVFSKPFVRAVLILQRNVCDNCLTR